MGCRKYDRTEVDWMVVFWVWETRFRVLGCPRLLVVSRTFGTPYEGGGLTNEGRTDPQVQPFHL